MHRKWVVTGWAAAAAVAVAAGIGAVALAQGGTLDPTTEPLSQDEALSQLESAQADTPGTSSSPSSSPSPEATESPAPTGELDTVPPGGAGTDEQVLDVKGGTVTARCAADGQVELVWWVASQGWRISSVDPGPGEDAEIEFEADDDIEYTIACVDGLPHSDTDDDDDDY